MGSEVDVGPLRGATVVVCRPAHQAANLIATIDQLGGVPIVLPLLELAPPVDGGAALVAALAELETFDWLILTSANAVTSVHAVRQEMPRSVRLAVVGPATAEAARDAGWNVDFEPTAATGKALATEFPFDAAHHRDRASERDADHAFDGHTLDPLPAPRLLAPLAELAADTLERILTERGAFVVRVDAYRMTTPAHTADARGVAMQADRVLLTSPSSADRFAALVNASSDDPGSDNPGNIESGTAGVLPPAIVIGPSTYTAALANGFDVVGVADPHTESGLVDALLRSIES